MSFVVDIVVLSNIDKEVAPGVEVLVGLPAKDPWSLPFVHQPIFRDRLPHYDLFIYSEDDILITERNIRAFLEVQEALPENEIAGFLRYEFGPDGAPNYPELHADFHWDPRSVRRRGEFTLAFFTNEHSACYVATRGQVKRAIDSGGFVVAPHREKYDLLCTAATDIYIQCGMRRQICVSHIDDFLVHHLPNKYVGSRFGIGDPEFRVQVKALLEIGRGERQATSLLPLANANESSPKHYYEAPDFDISSLIPAEARALLSLGCGWGATETLLAEKGLQVVAVPLDPVIGACAQERGVETTPADFAAALNLLAGRKFDVLLISNLLHLLENPAEVLSSFAGLLSERGMVIVKTPNASLLSNSVNRLRGKRSARDNHATSPRKALRSWLEAAGLKIEKIAHVPTRNGVSRRISLGLLDRWLAAEIVAVSMEGDRSIHRRQGNLRVAARPTIGVAQQ